MSLTALLMSMCLHTALPCEEIEIEWAPLKIDVGPRDSWGGKPILKGRATIYEGGRKLIQINERLKDWTDWQVRDVVMHELAHHLTWHKHPTGKYPAHGRQFRHACYEIANAIKVPTVRCKGGFL